MKPTIIKIEKHENGYIAYVKSPKNIMVIGEGKTVHEAILDLGDALKLFNKYIIEKNKISEDEINKLINKLAKGIITLKQNILAEIGLNAEQQVRQNRIRSWEQTALNTNIEPKTIPKDKDIKRKLGIPTKQ
jgi:predicted RNase H-like HicB family nuclease